MKVYSEKTHEQDLETSLCCQPLALERGPSFLKGGSAPPHEALPIDKSDSPPGIVPRYYVLDLNLSPGIHADSPL